MYTEVMGLAWHYWAIMAIFSLGYFGIIFEFWIRLNKTAIALFIGVVCWTIFFIGQSDTLSANVDVLGRKLSDISQILFFLVGAMTLVELIDSHRGFSTIIRLIHTHAKRRMLWIVSFLTFFLSSILDNLTTTILMISMLRKLVPNKRDRLVHACMIIIAANAGGAWTPIGDVTTTMLWIKGQITSFAVMQSLFLPSLFCMLVPLALYSIKLKGEYPVDKEDLVYEKKEPGARIVFYLGLLSFIMVPIFHWFTGLAPFMGMILALSFLWFVTDCLHYKHESRQHLRIPHILTKIDVSNILFFLGILLTIDALEAIGFLNSLSKTLQDTFGNVGIIATMIGLFSAIIDNVPLVAATMGMYPLESYPVDSQLWTLIAYAAGTGGSILLIGSSSGVAMMGMEKVDFFRYMRVATLPALLGYFCGILIYFVQN